MNFIYNMMNLLPFEFIQYDFMKNALIAVIVITPLFALLGTMAVNNKMAFFSDALGHSAFTGIAIGILLGLKNPVLSMVAFGIFLGLVISRVKSFKTASTDTIISVFSSMSVALGIVILSKNGGFSKYSSYLIGDILIVTPREAFYMLIVLIVCYIIWIYIYNKLLLISINSSGIKQRNKLCINRKHICNNAFGCGYAFGKMDRDTDYKLISYTSAGCGKEYCNQFKAVSFLFPYNRCYMRNMRAYYFVLCRHIGRSNNGAYLCGGIFYNFVFQEKRKKVKKSMELYPSSVTA